MVVGTYEGQKPKCCLLPAVSFCCRNSLAGWPESLWLSKLGLLTFSRQVNYLKVYLAHGKRLASLTHQNLKVQAIPTVPFHHSTDTGELQLVKVRYQFIYLPNLSTHVKRRSPPKTPQFGWGKEVMPQHITYCSVHIWKPLHKLCILFIWPRGEWWVQCSNTCLRKYFMQVLQEWDSTSILKVGNLQSVLRFGVFQ